jgi:hypothetical protein
MDPANPIVLLCIQGMRYEGEGRYEDARAQFVRAWDESTDGYEACIAPINWPASFEAPTAQNNLSKL